MLSVVERLRAKKGQVGVGERSKQSAREWSGRGGLIGRMGAALKSSKTNWEEVRVC